jgi:excinuclease ABC subunit A
MTDTPIVIRGAREHNLQDVSLTLPRNQLIVMTGVSGSGKSSLAFDTLYAEGQRRYVESLSSYARQFLGQMPKPDVDSISGLAPSISIQQKSAGKNPRSTVGTITEVYDYLRVLFARVGHPSCYQCGRPITAQTTDHIVDAVCRLPPGTRYSVLAPLVQRQKGEFRDLFDDLQKQGYLRARVDGRVVQLSEQLRLDKQMKHTIDVVVDRLVAGQSPRGRVAEAVEQALGLAQRRLIISVDDPTAEIANTGIAPERSRAASNSVEQAAPTVKPARRKKGARSADEDLTTDARLPKDSPMSAGGTDDDEASLAARMSAGDAVPPTAPNETLYSCDYACTHCGISYQPPSPQLFSFNSPLGMCSECNGLGEAHRFTMSKLLSDESLSIAKGAFAIFGKLSTLGRWRRHVLEGVAKAIEADHKWAKGKFLKTPWKDLPESAKSAFLDGMPGRQLLFAFKHRGGVWQHGGQWNGVIPDLLNEYRTTKNPLRRKQLEKFLEFGVCPSCHGSRLSQQACSYRLTTSSAAYLSPVSVGGQDQAATTPTSALSLPEVCHLSIARAIDFFDELVLDDTEQIIAEEVLKEIRGRLGFLLRCGLDYLTLDRTAPTLSGGESQRIRLAGQIGCGLVGVVYILDEPSIGLHPKDNALLLGSLKDLRDQGNTVIVVEHDEDTMRAADHVVDFGPGPGVRGGQVVAEGPLSRILAAENSLTGAFLSGRRQIAIPAQRRPGHGIALRVTGARHHNLQNVTVDFPLGTFICVTGASGSGKSSLINDILWQVLQRDLNGGEGQPGEHDDVRGLEHVDKAIDIDQTPIGRTPRSNPATYVKLFDLIRDLYTQLPESKLRGFPPGRFSFNVPGGRCEACEGHGSNKLEMDFLADVWVTCPVCQGRRFNKETLEVRFKGKNIAEVLDMDIQQALVHFETFPKIKQLLQTLHDVGLDYLKLGQPSPTLSGGEAQRVKLAKELGKRSTGKTVYILDEPTTGLHFVDIEHLLRVLHGFVAAGNTVIVVEHNLDVIKTADWVIDLGPDGGVGGGRVVVEGTPEHVAACNASYTGQALRAVLPTSSIDATAMLPLAVNSGTTAASGDRKAGRSGSRGKTAKKNGASTTTPTTDAVGTVRPAATVAPALTSTARRLQDSPRWQSAQALQAEIGADKNIVVRGAAQHNLQQVNVSIPREKISVFCGPSGSGKSSLAMDTLYAEGQRRYVESLSSYARQFLGQMPKPRVEQIHGLQPAIAIEQKTVGHTPRSTIGTVTEIHDYLRILYARLGTQFCPDCQQPVQAQTTDDVIDQLQSLPESTRLLVLAPQEVPVGQQYSRLWERLQEQGFRRVRVDGETYSLEEVPEIDRRRKHQVEIVVDRVTIQAQGRGRLAESIGLAFDLGQGIIRVATVDESRAEKSWKVQPFSLFRACQKCNRSFEELTPQNFSFNSPLGWCPVCEGLGTQQGMSLSHVMTDLSRTLRDGAIAAWPDPKSRPLFARMLEAISQECDLPLDVPYSQLEPAQQQVVLQGTGDRWFTLTLPLSSSNASSDGVPSASTSGAAAGPGSGAANPTVASVGSSTKAARSTKAAVAAKNRRIPAPPLAPSSTLRFQYKGLYPAFEEASRVSYSYRAQLFGMVGEVPCAVCSGSRLRNDAGAVRLNGKTLQQLGNLPLVKALEFLRALPLNASQRRIAGDLLTEATSRLSFLVDVGLHYLTLNRPLPTLSGGETQRIRLAGQIGRSLTGVLYVLDEPTIGLHPSDNGRLLSALQKLRNLGNTIVMVEHDRDVLQAADRLYDFGPGAGRFGGTVTATGSPEVLCQDPQSLTGKFLADREQIVVPDCRRTDRSVAADLVAGTADLSLATTGTASGDSATAAQTNRPAPLKATPQTAPRRTKKALSSAAEPSSSALPRSASESAASAPATEPTWIELRGARQNNLRSVDLKIPLRTLTAITGVSGSGKSSLIEETLARAISRQLHRSSEQPGPFDELLGIEHLNKLIVVDQQPLGSTPASNPATYTGVFDEIRELFARIPEAKVRGYRPARFSFNRTGGRCEACEGNGQKKIEMHFLPDVWVECDVCRGQRYNAETLAVKYHGKSIADVLGMSIADALELFGNLPKIRGPLAVLAAIGLDYLTLGQSAPTLSGGEAQRVKLAAELSRPQSGRTLYLLDEPTTGLHFDDIRKLLKILNSLVDAGNTVVVIEHNLDVIKTADWVIDLGPGAGVSGGHIVVSGTPEQIVAQWKNGGSAAHPLAGQSLTAQCLAPVLASSQRGLRDAFDVKSVAAKRSGDLDIAQIGRNAKMPWDVNGRQWHLEQHLARNGREARWPVGLLEQVIAVCEADNRFAPVKWNTQLLVEVSAPGLKAGWFLHAITGDERMLHLTFRVQRRTFEQESLEASLNLADGDALDDLPLRGRPSRVQVTNADPPWQKVTLWLAQMQDVQTNAFQTFLQQAIESYWKVLNPEKRAIEDFTPWKTLGRKWHLMSKGFLKGTVMWSPGTLETVLDTLAAAWPDGEIDWSNKVLVHFNNQGRRMATVVTKRPASIDVCFPVARGRFGAGRFLKISDEARVVSEADRDLIEIPIVSLSLAQLGEFRHVLQEL